MNIQLPAARITSIRKTLGRPYVMMRARETSATGDSANKTIFVLLVLVSAVYLLQLASPLRLSPDAVVYLSMAASAAEGNGFLFQGDTTHFPAGYPLILLTLERAGVGASWAFIGLNCVFLAVGLAASYQTLRDELGLGGRVAAALCCLTLLSSVFINHVVMPLSDFVFFGFSMLCVRSLSWAGRQRGAKRWYGMTAAAVLLLMSIAVRTIGVALVPALVWACLPTGFKNQALSGTAVGKKKKLLLVFTLLLAVGIPALSRTEYLRGAVNVYASGGAGTALTLVNYRSSDWGELVANTRIATAPTPLRLGFKLIGLMTFVLALYGLWLRRRCFGAVEIYILSFVLVLLVWPYTDGRFWLPIVPLLMGLLTVVIRRGVRRHPRLKIALVSYLIWFTLAGVAALGLNTRSSLGDAKYPQLDAAALSVVKRFERRFSE